MENSVERKTRPDSKNAPINGEIKEELTSEKIELFSEDVQEILGQPPKWIVRWGITVVISILAIILSGSFIFKYPDVISGSVTIVSENPPIPIVAQVTGKIELLFVKDQEMIKSGSILAILENTANYRHMQELKDKLKLLQKRLIIDETFDFIEFPDNLSLGSVQETFSNFQRQYNGYRNYLAINSIGKKILALRGQISDYKRYLEQIHNQANNLKEVYLLQYNQFRRDSLLYSNGVIALTDFDKSKQVYLQAKNNYQGLLTSISNTAIQLNQIQYQTVDLHSQLLDQTGSMFNSLKESFNNLLGNISLWEKSYVLTSPIDGKITFVNFWSPNQHVVSGNQVFTVVPAKPQNIMGKLKFTTTGSGKVEKGQRVLIRLDNFPSAEFGTLEGRIIAISLIPETTQQGSYYSAEVNFEKGLITNYGKVLPLNQEMQGTAEIITKNLSLFLRLVQPLKAVLEKNK
jgi:multidrug resistance efflux pump